MGSQQGALGSVVSSWGDASGVGSNSSAKGVEFWGLWAQIEQREDEASSQGCGQQWVPTSHDANSMW